MSSTSSLLDTQILENLNSSWLSTNIPIDTKFVLTILRNILDMFPSDSILVDIFLRFFQAITATSVGSLVDAPSMLDNLSFKILDINASKNLI